MHQVAVHSQSFLINTIQSTLTSTTIILHKFTYRFKYWDRTEELLASYDNVIPVLGWSQQALRSISSFIYLAIIFFSVSLTG